MRFGIALCFLWMISFARSQDDDLGGASLYDVTDPIIELGHLNFNKIVYNSIPSFVEFYSSWCGGCVAYAPKWKQFSRDIKPWSSVVQIAALNCALDENTALCREHDIEKYPSIKFFSSNSSRASDGRDYNGPKSDLPAMAADLAQLIAVDSMAHKSKTKPSFERLNKLMNLDEIVPNTDNYVAIVFEDDNDEKQVANQVILDLSSEKSLTVLAAPSDYEILKNERLELPALMIFKRDDLTKPIYKSSDSVTRLSAVSKIREFCELAARAVTDAGKTSTIAQPKEKGSSLAHHQVHYTDLLSGISYMFKQEIGMHKHVDAKGVGALRQFMALLAKYFPGTPPVRRLLYRLNKWVQEKEAFTGEEWIENYENVQEDLGRPLPQNVTWVSCKGSKPNFRGYPCALWTIFHTLTVQAYKTDGQSSAFDALQTLEAIHAYIKEFFGCRECSDHFENGAKHLAEVVKEPEDVVLWLWRGHNIPNKFLAGTETEDPDFPKSQFPPKALCLPCRNADDSWNQKEVLEFLLRFYSSIASEDKQLPYKISSFSDGKKDEGTRSLDLNPKFRDLGRNLDKEEQRNALIKKEKIKLDADNWSNFSVESSKVTWGSWLVGWTGLDTSICLSLWVISVLLVCFIFVYLKYRKNRSKFWKIYYSEYKV